MDILEQIASIISIISIAVVIYGTIIAAFSFLRAELLRFKKKYSAQRIRVIRADLGTYLLLGLELLIAADILKTILEPRANELIVLGGIVLLRTILSFFLGKEIKEIDAERHAHPELFEQL